MKRALLFAALFAIAAPASATLCTLSIKDSTCTFASDTSGGTVLFRNPTNLSNIGSGEINPFLGTQVGGSGGVQTGVNTDQPAVNQLPLDDKRDNSNTFTETMRLNQLGFVTIAGVDYFTFFLDINEPNNDESRFLSLDRLAIFGRTGANAGDPLDLNSTNITSLADVDLFPNLELVYRLGIGNTLILDYDLFAGSGLGYDMSLLVPTSAFSNLAPNSRIVFAVSYGAGDACAGCSAQDGFEEWAFLPGAGPRVVPEPNALLLLAAGLIGFAAIRQQRHRMS